MTTAWKQNKIWLSLLACAFLVICAISLTKMYFNVDVEASSTSTDKSSETTTWSFATMSQAASKAFGDSVLNPTPGFNGAPSILASLGVQSDQLDPIYMLRVAGDLSGYGDVKISDGVIQGFTSTVADNAINYDFRDISTTLNSSTSDDLLYFIYYAGLGNMLQELGFDEVCESGVVDPIRVPVGTLFTAAYSMSTGVDSFWKYVITFLEYIDPFRAFGDISVRGSLSDDLQGAVDGVPVVDNEGNPVVGDEGNDIRRPADGNSVSSVVVFYLMNGLNSLSRVCSNIYNKLHSSAFIIIIPLIAAFALFRWLVVEKGSNFGKTFKDFAIKIVYISIGVPLGLAIYSTAVGLVSNYVVGHANASSKIVASVFFDFNKFANTNMAMDDDIWFNNQAMYNVETWSVTSDTYNRIRTICLLSFDNENVASTTANRHTTTNATGNIGFTDWDLYVAKVGLSRLGSDNDHLDGDAKSEETTMIFEMLQRYIKGDVTLPSSVESRVKRGLVNEGYNPNLSQDANSEQYSRVMSRFNYVSHMSDESSSFLISDYNKHKITVGGELDRTITPEEALTYVMTRWDENAQVTSDHNFNMSDSVGNIWGHSGLGAHAQFSSRRNLVAYYNGINGRSTGLSDMGMYNYLSTKFSSGSYTIASSLNSSNDKALYAHYSVNLVGTGMIRMVFIGVSLCSMLVFVLLGYLYGFGILVASVRALFKMIPAVFTGMAGFKNGIATTFVILFALIAEILGTCLLYAIAADFMYAVYNLIEAPFVSLMSNVLTKGDSGVDAHFLIPLQGVCSIVISVVMVKNLIKYRYAICQSLAEMSRDIINRFLGTNVNDANISMPMNSLGEIAKAAPLGLAALSVGAETASGKSHGQALGLDSESGDIRPHDDSAVQKKIDEEYGDSTDNGKHFGEQQADDRAEAAAAREQADKIAQGRTPDETAENYVADNEAEFEKQIGAGGMSGATASVAAGAEAATGTAEAVESDDSGGKISLAKKDTNGDISVEGDEDTKTLSIAGNESGEIVDKNGSAGRIVNAETGEPYTAEDQKNGAAYSVVDSDGNAIVSHTGQTLENMPAATLTPQAGGIVSMATEGGNVSFASVPDANIASIGSQGGLSAVGGTVDMSGGNAGSGASGGGTSGSSASAGGTMVQAPAATYVAGGTTGILNGALTGLTDGSQSITVSPVVGAAAAGYMAGAMTYGANPVQAVTGAAVMSTVAGGSSGIMPAAASIPGEAHTTVTQSATVIQGSGADGAGTVINTTSNSMPVGDAAGGHVVNTGGGDATVVDMDVQQTINQTAVSETTNSESSTTNKSSNNNTNANIEVGGDSDKPKGDKSGEDSGADDIMQGAADITGKIFNTFGKVVNQFGQSMRDKRNPPGGK